MKKIPANSKKLPADMEKVSIRFSDVLSLNTDYNLLNTKQDEGHKNSHPGRLAYRYRQKDLQGLKTLTRRTVRVPQPWGCRSGMKLPGRLFFWSYPKKVSSCRVDGSPTPVNRHNMGEKTSQGWGSDAYLERRLPGCGKGLTNPKRG